MSFSQAGNHDKQGSLSSALQYAKRLASSIAKPGVVIQLADGTIQSGNYAAEQISGFTLEQMQSWTSADFLWQAFHEDGSPFPAGTHPVTVALQTGQPGSNVLVGLSKPDGQLIWLIVDTQPLFLANHTTPYAVMVSFAEITTSKTIASVQLNSMNSRPFEQPETKQSETKQPDIVRITDATVNTNALDPLNLKQAQNALYQSNAILNAINQFTPTLIYMKDRQGRMIMANPALLNLVNLPASTVIGYTTLDFHHPRAAAEEIMANDRQVIETEQTLQFEEMLETATGPRWFLSVKSPYRDEQGDVIGLIGISTEISDRKRTEALLQTNQAILQQQLAEIEAIYQSAPIGLSFVSADFRFLRINHRLAEINGVAVADHIGRTVREIVPDLADTAEALLQTVIDSGLPRLDVEIQGETPARPGVPRIWVEHFLPVKDEHNQVVGINVVCEDVTEHRQAEAALRSSEERLRIAQRVAQGGSWDWHIVTNTVIWSEEYYDLYGVDSAQVEPTYANWLSLTHADDRDRVNQTILAALERDTEINIVFRAVHPHGVRWFNAIGKIFRDLDEQPFRMTGITFDITDRKHAELEREQLLEREQRAREQAEQANQVKDEFLAILSHELRTPLNPILGWARLLQTNKFNPEKTQQALATIERNAKLQVQLVDDLLDISRVLRGKLALNLEPVSLIAVIGAALETVRLPAEAKAIQIETDFDPALDTIRGDAGRLQQVIWNLLTNAIKFTSKGGQIAVRLEQMGNYAQITVTDTGKGINPDFLPHIFEYFRQEDSSMTRQHGGLGLGLAISRQLVEAHGGTIAATNRTDQQGAVLTVRLPLIQAAPLPEVSCDHQTFDLAEIRVLLVDDEPDSLEWISTLLTTQGAIVTAVTSASEALEALARSPFDLLISDIAMPHINGHILIQQIRSSPEAWCTIPAIALTAYASAEDQDQSTRAGYHQHLAKPVDVGHLVAAVSQLVRG